MELASRIQVATAVVVVVYALVAKVVHPFL
jgi:hypothetical protein